MSLKRWQTAREKIDHRAAQARYQKSPEQLKKRENRNLARAHMEKEGKAHVGDGKDIEHKDGNALNNNESNWKAGSRHKNRSYPRTSRAHKLHPGD
jgi:hypothetical protein